MRQLLMSEERWRLVQADCIEHLETMPRESVDFSVFSPPFPSLFAYTDSEADIGNSEDFAGDAKLHLSFFFHQLIGVMKPGRVVICHCQQIAGLKRNAEPGTIDFRGLLIRLAKRAGFTYWTDWPVTKNPQALRDGTGVLTPHGFVPVDCLTIGSDVIGSDGNPTEVVGVWPQGKQQLYRVHFNDGAAVDCHADHLWTVDTLPRRTQRHTLTTAELYRRGAVRPSGQARYSTPLIPDANFARQELPLDPYLVGVLLGDGMLSSRGVAGVCTEREIVHSLALPDDHYPAELKGGERGNDVSSFHIRCDEWHRNDVLDACRELGMAGKRAWEKFIPPRYLFSSREERIAVLQGLMDTDGTIKKNGSCYFASTSKRLAEGVQFLVESLGGMAAIKIEEYPQYECQGERRTGRTRYVCCVRLPRQGGVCPFRMTRKADKWKPLARDIHRRIVSIEKIDCDDCTCITVAASDGLFVTERCVVTHNSQAIRTRSQKLQFAQLERDRCRSAPAFNDYLIMLLAPGENEVPINGNPLTRNEWIEWAEGVWDWRTIRETDTLNTAAGKGEDDTKHICPLQLPVIERCVRLYSNPDEIVLSPFAGIGSEGHVSLKLGRRFYGIELKDEYIAAATKNLESAARAADEQLALFAEA